MLGPIRAMGRQTQSEIWAVIFYCFVGLPISYNLGIKSENEVNGLALGISVPAVCLFFTDFYTVTY